MELAGNMGAGKIIMAQRSKARLEMARKFRADVFISTLEEDLVSRVMEETEGKGADVVVTACASPEAQEQSLLLVRNRGRINFFGGLAKDSRKINIDSNIIHYKECFIHGAHGSVPRQHRIALRLLAGGAIKPQDFISHHFSLSRIDEAFDTVEKRKGMKVIVNP
jgi:L-iditol 2-dehydrogenase